MNFKSMTRIHPRAAAVLAAALLAGCAPAAGEQGGHPAPHGPARAPAVSGVEADVRFLQHMTVHHAQAVEMTALVPERAASPGLRLLAERIEVSQADEMAMMARLLRERGAAVPDEHAHHTGAHAGMPGMISPERMARLRAARGEAFDRLFLELMIEHHEGAIAMVAELLATDGAAQDPEIFSFAAHVESDQRMEIERMRRMLERAPAGALPR
jgi:uncharacterized protein (DUF305 family)